MTDVLSKYYHAMNAHDVQAALIYLAPHIEVTFPEAERNWSGRDNADEKFAAMFVRMPTFHGSYEVNSVEHLEPGKQLVRVSCRFVCQQSNADSSRDMEYCVENDKFTVIRHL
ncbi:hypothetical protein CYMTET_28281 [Cymbomonas tetramitiformis]|uniref:SnoaL-like domain-containing protein n=1 Tax=Cymbomonas tetramitiformis TaxID=36881 RepID=A0AAE0FNP1_9CHLO|nr:hypothetical protein CYMTET_28281 [Cymbomonas tetramitiformis]